MHERIAITFSGHSRLGCYPTVCLAVIVEFGGYLFADDIIEASTGKYIGSNLSGPRADGTIPDAAGWTFAVECQMVKG